MLKYTGIVVGGTDEEIYSSPEIVQDISSALAPLGMFGGGVVLFSTFLCVSEEMIQNYPSIDQLLLGGYIFT